jgi:predicted RNA-binding Zn-ribbon protein involved in translation (DUF1610 family)
MKRRICRDCGAEMLKELTPDGAEFSCDKCDGNNLYDEYDMDPYCPECDKQLEFCKKCGVVFFCNTCGVIVSRKKIVWKEK